MQQEAKLCCLQLLKGPDRQLPYAAGLPLLRAQGHNHEIDSDTVYCQILILCGSTNHHGIVAEATFLISRVMLMAITRQQSHHR